MNLHTRQWVLVTVAAAVVVTVHTLRIDPDDVAGGLFTDKQGHAILFLALGAATAAVTWTLGRRVSAFWVLVVGLGTGLLGEGVQLLLPYRTAEFWDLAVDWVMTGGVAGVVYGFGVDAQLDEGTVTEPRR